MGKQTANIAAHIEEACSSVSDLPGFVEQGPRKPVINKEELHGKVTFWLALSTVVISIGAGVPLGYNAGVMTVAAPFILEFLNATNQEKWNGNAPELAITWIYSCTVTVYSVGGAFGTIVGGRFSDSLGRKYSTVVCAILLPIAGLLMGVSQIAGIYGLLFLGRFVTGLYGGISLVILPVYLAEISPVNLRGAIGVFSVFMTVAGQLFSHVRHTAGAFETLQQLRGKTADISTEIEEMKIEAQRNESGPTDRGLFFYTTEIFESAGLDQTEIALATVGYSTVNVFSTIIGVLLVDRVGRRPLLLYPFMAGLVLLLGMTVSINTQDDLDWMKWLTIAIVFLFTAIFGIGPVSVKNLIAAELWLQSTRPAAVSITFQATWWAMAFISLIFPLLNEEIGGYTFLIFFTCLLIATILLYRYLPETKNKTFEEITANFVKSPKQKRKGLEEDLGTETYVNGGAVKETDIIEDTKT
ncbi:solute carrier family 2, facilitated glucose transporter member 5-like [Amphiura filiformis]|uniref:solute carrier family 2, facilitated glucose transporter member 5-like n=1 Tax=Amphiura filiformis TaxID=82378 RepID=UPI003B21E495